TILDILELTCPGRAGSILTWATKEMGSGT
ncbi:unnamed protein product, partial [marine sediment metagenome]